MMHPKRQTHLPVCGSLTGSQDTVVVFTVILCLSLKKDVPMKCGGK